MKNQITKLYATLIALVMLVASILGTLLVQSNSGVLTTKAVGLTVNDLFEEPISQGSETYEVKEDGIHVYANDIVFSGESDKKFFIEPIEEGYTDIYFKDAVISNSICGTGLVGTVILHFENSTVEGDVTIEDNGEDDLYFSAYIVGANAVKGAVTSGGSFTIYGEPDASLEMQRATAQTMLYVFGLRLDNVSETYVLGTTKTLTPLNTESPVKVTTKKEAIFPDTETFVVNNGKPFAVGEDYTITPPVVCDENGEPFATQPTLIVQYYEVKEDGDFWESVLLDEKPTEAGNYEICFYMPEDDQMYTGSASYEFSIATNNVVIIVIVVCCAVVVLAGLICTIIFVRKKK